MRTCGTCTLCCKVMAVGDIDKPANVWCRHCDKTSGCTIYNHRPKSCREFECIWLQRDDVVPEKFKPSRSRVVLISSGDGIAAMVDPGMPDAWKDPELLVYLQGLSSRMTVVADTGKRAFQIVPWGYRELAPNQIKRSVGSNGYLVNEPISA